MLQSDPLFPLSTEWRARGPHCHSSEVRRATLRVPVHCAYLVEPTLSLKCFLRAHTQTGKVSAVCSVGAHREGFMSGRPAANLSSGITAATNLVVMVQPWLMTVAGWHVNII